MGETPEVEESSPAAAKQRMGATVRGLADRDFRNPAHPEVSRAQPPLRMAGTKKAPDMMLALVRLKSLDRPRSAAEFAAAPRA